MHSAIKYAVLGLVMLGIWYGAWSWSMASERKTLQDSIHYHNQKLKAVTPHMVLKAESINTRGFPFHSRVVAEQFSLSMIQEKQTYLVRFTEVAFHKNGRDWRVELPNRLDALYAEDGAAPEHYEVTVSDVPGFLLRADNNEKDALLTQYRAFMPAKMTVHMTLGADSRDTVFTLPPMDFLAYMPIPHRAEHTLWLFVSVLREALVFKTPEAQ